MKTKEKCKTLRQTISLWVWQNLLLDPVWSTGPGHEAQLALHGQSVIARLQSVDHGQSLGDKGREPRLSLPKQRPSVPWFIYIKKCTKASIISYIFINQIFPLISIHMHNALLFHGRSITNWLLFLYILILKFYSIRLSIICTIKGCDIK